MEKVFTNLEHVAWLREQARLKRPYWYGTFFLPCTEELLQKKAKQYPGHYTAARMTRYRQDIKNGQTCGDCVNGAIKGAIWSELGKRKPVYGSHDCPDVSADGMFQKCKAWGMEWGMIDTMPDEPGIAVRMAQHVGVYVGNGEVVEWRGFKYGCVVTKLKSRKWLHWYRLPWTEYVGAASDSAQEPASATTTARPTLRKGDKGEAVKTLQRALVAAGRKLPKYGADGDFGDETLAAVEVFQKAEGLMVDGVVGAKTWAALDNPQKPASAATTARRTLHRGDDGPLVVALQQALLAAGCTLPQHGADGDFGGETRAAVMAFQRQRGLLVDGIVGPKTWAALDAVGA